MIRSALAVVLLSFVPWLLLAAQASPDEPRLAAEGVELRIFRPENIDAARLCEVLQQLHGRTLQFVDGRATPNILQGSDSIIVYEEKSRLQQIAATIAEIDKKTAASARDLQVLAYEPRGTDLQRLFGLARILFGRTLQRADGTATETLTCSDRWIVVTEVGAAAEELRGRLQALDDELAATGTASASAIEYMPRAVPVHQLVAAIQQVCSPGAVCNLVGSQGLLVVRDGAQNLEMIRRVLDRIDRPAPQLMLSAFVLTGSDDVGGNAPQDELAESLRKVLPYRAFRVESASVLRVSARPGNAFSLDLVGPVNGLAGRAEYRLQGTVSAYDEAAVALALSDLSATDKRDGQPMFATETTIFGSEYAVLGVVGSGQMFFVVRVQPVGSTPARKNN